MIKEKLIGLMITVLSSMAVLFAAVDIVPAGNGYFYTDSLYSKIYFTDGVNHQVLIECPGAGRFYTVSPDNRYIGFKFRNEAGGMEQPAVYDTRDSSIEFLHEPVNCSGQVSFSKDGKIAFTIDTELFVQNGSDMNRYSLGFYANLAPISPDGHAAVFNDDQDQLFMIDLNTGKTECITEAGSGHVFPSWSYDSRYIAYARLDGTVRIYDTDRKITKDLGMAAGIKWSPVSNDFAYTGITLSDDRTSFTSDIVVSNMETGQRISTDTKDRNETAPVYLNDGSVMALITANDLDVVYSTTFKKSKNTAISNFPVSPVVRQQLLPTEDSYLNVPYIHQVYDTPGQRGYSSCAPTTAAMVLAYYGLLPKWPFKSGFDNWNDYGAYVHERYYYNGYYFNQEYQDCNSSGSYCYTCYGGMGYMWSGGSPNSKMAGYYNKHGVSANQTWSTTWSTVTTEIDKKQPFSICNFLSSSGHLIVALGRAENNQRTVIANDPYGDRNRSTWPNYYGKAVLYDWPGYNHGHASLNYANSGYTTMPWCIATNYHAPALVDSVVDDKQLNAGFYMKTDGNTVPMRYYHSHNSGYKGHHWWTYTETGQADICYVTWTPQVGSGYYDIKAYIPANAGATSAEYSIHHAAGNTKVVIDQSSYADTLISLGKYLMKNDGSNYVYLGDSTAVSSEILVFDAMIWETTDLLECDIVSDHTHGYPEFPVNFHVISTLPGDDYDYTWDFGDGSFAAGDSVAHAYADTGTYTITLTVEADGVSIERTRSDMIVIGQNTYTGTEIKTMSPDSMETINNLNPIFIWEDQGQMTLLSISETPEFDTPYFNVSTATNIYALEQNLVENKTYYWTVSAGGNSSKVCAFRINVENSLPLPFDLSSPENGSIADTLRPCFEWLSTREMDPGDEIVYKLYLGTHEDSIMCIYEGPETSFRVNEDLKENAWYTWYVNAVDMSMAVRRSTGISHLGINTINEVPPAPVQIAPNHNSYQTTRYPHLEWTSVQDPDPGDEVHYEVFYWYEGSKVYVINTHETSHDERRFNDLKEYFWTVAAVDLDDEYAYSDTQTIYFNTQLDVVDIPEECSLSANYPNPFNPVTSISYGVPVTGDVDIMIYDLSGKAVCRLVSGWHQPGFYSVQFDASSLSSGVYIYKMTAGDFNQSRKMLLLK